MVGSMVKNYNEILYDNETLFTERLILRKFTKEDAPDVLEWGSNEEALRYLSWQGVTTIDEAKAAIFDHNLSRPGIFAIELKETGECIGSLDLKIEPDHDKLVFGYVLKPAYWGKGYMTEALAAVLELCFEKLDANRVEALHYAGNVGSGKVMTKCGMKLEGIAKQGLKIKGIFHDVCHYGITKEDWLAKA